MESTNTEGLSDLENLDVKKVLYYQCPSKAPNTTSANSTAISVAACETAVAWYFEATTIW